jgi:hypothetical protein
VDIKMTDDKGNPLTGVTLGKAAKICLPFTAADAQGSFGGVNGLAIYRYSETARQWIPLVTTADPVSGLICTNSANFSLFAIGLAPDPVSTATPTAVAPTATPTRTATATPPPPATATPVPQPTATPSLPPTGDYAPGSGVLAVVALIGLALVALGILAMRRTRKSGTT